MRYVSRERAIAHLNEPENLRRFQADKGRSVEDYFADYEQEWAQDNGGKPDALYQCVCADLDIVPLQPDRERVDRTL